MNVREHFGGPPAARHILMIQLGDIGDVVWSLPAIKAVRNAYPSAVVSILLREGVGSLLGAEEWPLKIFEVRKDEKNFVKTAFDAFALLTAICREHFDFVIDFRADERGGYVAFLTGAPLRAAHYYPGLKGLRNHLFTHLVEMHDNRLLAKPADRSLQILQAFGIKAKDAMPELHLSDEVRLRGASVLRSIGIPVAQKEKDNKVISGVTLERGKTWVTVNPFSRWSYKEWGMEKWVRIIDWLYEEFNIRTVLVGSPEEQKKAETLAGACPEKIVNMAGRTTLAELAGVLALSRLHIGVDSAAPHIAAAVGTPTVTIYGPSDWRYWRPPGERNHVVVPDMPCAPCSLKGCNGGGRSICLEKMEVEKVQAVIRKVLAD